MGDGIHQFAAGPTNPDDLDFDRGNCTQNRTHIANMTMGYQTPRLAVRSCALIASDWRVSGILNAQFGQLVDGSNRARYRAQRPGRAAGEPGE